MASFAAASTAGGGGVTSAGVILTGSSVRTGGGEGVSSARSIEFSTGAGAGTSASVIWELPLVLSRRGANVRVNILAARDDHVLDLVGSGTCEEVDTGVGGVVVGGVDTGVEVLALADEAVGVWVGEGPDPIKADKGRAIRLAMFDRGVDGRVGVAGACCGIVRFAIS